MDIEFRGMLSEFREEHSLDCSDEELKGILESPWYVLRSLMGSERFTEVRLPYFGVFRPISGMVEKYESGEVK